MNKEPLFHISKRDGLVFWKAWLFRLIAFALSLVVCSIVIVLITKLNPLQIYESIVDGAVGTQRRMWVTYRDTLILLLVAVALTPAFKMRFWNIGAEGQILVGGLVTAAIMINCNSVMPGWLMMLVLIISSLAAGAIWGIIPAIFKAKWNTNETLFTLMLNYVATQLVMICINFWENPKGSNNVGTINMNSEKGWLPPLFNYSYGWLVVIVLALVIFMFVYLKYSKQGYEISVVGESENTARYAGINVKKVIIRTMAISGAISGLAGFLVVSGSSHTISSSTAGGRGFTAIIVAWLAKFNTFVMILISFILVFIEKGSIQIASKYNLNENMSDVLTGIILFFIIGSEFFINYKVQFRSKLKGEK